MSSPSAGSGPHAALTDLIEVMDRLRSPGGCPWDAQQTHASLVPYAIEEVYEVAEAVESGDHEGLREELGDLLLQVVFHARLATEHPTAPFDIDDVAAGIAAKLRRRHPHVFGGTTVSGAAEVNRRWDEIKREEKSRESVLDGVPAALPALARAQKVLGRAGRAGLEVPTPGEDLPGRLLALAAEAQAAGVEAETVLRDAVRSLESVLRAQERGEQQQPPPPTGAGARQDVD